MDAEILRSQIQDSDSDPQIRVANLNSMADLQLNEDNQLLVSLLGDENEQIRATAFEHCIKRELPDIIETGLKAIKEDTLLVARKVISGLAVKSPESMIELWKERELELNPSYGWIFIYHFHQMTMRNRKKLLQLTQQVNLAEFTH